MGNKGVSLMRLDPPPETREWFFVWKPLTGRVKAEKLAIFTDTLYAIFSLIN